MLSQLNSAPCKRPARPPAICHGICHSTHAVALPYRRSSYTSRLHHVNLPPNALRSVTSYAFSGRGAGGAQFVGGLSGSRRTSRLTIRNPRTVCRPDEHTEAAVISLAARAAGYRSIQHCGNIAAGRGMTGHNCAHD